MAGSEWIDWADEGYLFVYDKFPKESWDKMHDLAENNRLLVAVEECQLFDEERNQRKLDRHFSGKGD